MKVSGVEATNGGITLAGIKFAEVSASAVSRGKASASVRQNGKIVFSNPANGLINAMGGTAEKPSNPYFRVGADETGKIYLVPAKAEDANTVKASKNGESFQLTQSEVFKALGVKPGNKYGVSAETIEDTALFVLTPTATAAAVAEPAKTEGAA